MVILPATCRKGTLSERGNPLPPLNGLLIPISSKFFFYMQHPTDRIAHTIAFVTPVVDHWLEREIIQWFQHDGFHKKVLRAVLKNKYIKQIIHVGDSRNICSPFCVFLRRRCT